jgi:hypothetical protein
LLIVALSENLYLKIVLIKVFPSLALKLKTTPLIPIGVNDKLKNEDFMHCLRLVDPGIMKFAFIVLVLAHTGTPPADSRAESSSGLFNST